MFAVAACLLLLLVLAPTTLAQNNSMSLPTLPNTKSPCKGATDTRSDGLDVFETVIDAPLQQLFWGNGDDSHLVFVLTKRLTVYRSDDDGVTWSDLSNNSVLSPGGQARVAHIVAVDGDSARFYFLSSDYHGLWTTRDRCDQACCVVFNIVVVGVIVVVVFSSSSSVSCDAC